MTDYALSLACGRDLHDKCPGHWIDRETYESGPCYCNCGCEEKAKAAKRASSSEASVKP